MIKQFLNAFKTMTVSSRVISMYDLIANGAQASSGVSVNTKTAMGVTAFLCAARVIAEGVAQAPLKVIREEIKDGRTYKTPAKNHSAYKLLHRAPNSWMTSFEFREMLTLHAVVTGDGVAIKNIVDGKVRELLPVAPEHLTIEQLPNWGIVYTVADRNGTIGRFTEKQVLHIRGPSWGGGGGMNIVNVAREAIGLAIAAEKSQAKIHKSGGRPPGILHSELELGSETVEKLRSSWESKYGPNGEGGIAILDGGKWKFDPLSASAADQQLIETRKFMIPEIARALRVFPIMLMESDKAATYASVEQFGIMHVVHSLGPWFERWEQALDRDIIGPDDDEHYAHFQLQGLMRGAQKDRAEYFSKALGAGGSQSWMTANDVRELEEMNPHEDGDKLNGPVTSQPKSTSEDKPEDEDVEKEEIKNQIITLQHKLDNLPAPTINVDARTTIHPQKIDITTPEMKFTQPNVDVHIAPPNIQITNHVPKKGNVTKTATKYDEAGNVIEFKETEDNG